MLIVFLFFFLFFFINILCLSVCEFLINCEYLFISKRLNRKIWEVYQNWKKKNGEQLQIGFSVLWCCCCSGVKNPYKKCTKFALEKFLMCVCVLCCPCTEGSVAGANYFYVFVLFCNLADFVHNLVNFFFSLKRKGGTFFCLISFFLNYKNCNVYLLLSLLYHTYSFICLLLAFFFNFFIMCCCFLFVFISLLI